MPVQGPGYQLILTKLLCDRNVSDAIKITLARGNNAYSFAKYCRGRIVRDDANRNPQYLQRVRDFQHIHFGPQDSEWCQLQALMEGSLLTQYRVEISRRPFFACRPSLDAALREIKCLPAEFYEYVLPDEVVESARERERERREARCCGAMNISNIQTFISRAREWREFTHPWELVACASILCGRRTQEIIWAANFTPTDRYLVHVTGLLKQAVGQGVIPLLVESDDFMELMSKIRENHLPSESTTHRLKPAFRRVFGEWLNHTQRRNVYCEAAYRMRDISGFHPTYPPVMWFDAALCHDSNVIHQAPSLAYQVLTFNE